MNPEQLLAEINGISKKYDLINKKTGGYYNIFDITDIIYQETKICKVIYEFINPIGSHYQGNTYLKLFVESVLHMDIPDEEYRDTKVYREFGTEENRRIDLAIKTSNHFIPIEVKIYANDQKDQCHDCFQKARNAKVFYLTLHGNSPSEYSAAGLTKSEAGYEEVCNISFENEILTWLSKCLENKDTIRIAPIREIVVQLMSAVRKLTNQVEEGKELEIQNLIMSSSENMSNAFEIERSLKDCKIEMMKKVFSTIEQRIGKEKLINEYDYEFNDGMKVNSFYNQKRSTYPGISYPYKQNIKDGVDIWFRIEIDWGLFAGFCVPYYGKVGEQKLTEQEIKANIPHVEPLIDDWWWAYYERLPVDDNTVVPDFKNPGRNNMYFKLFDKEYFDKFIDDCVVKINKLFI